MGKSAKRIVEGLAEETFVGLQHIVSKQGITVKRMRELLPSVLLQTLKRDGMTQQEIIAASGYTRRSIRRIMSTNLEKDETDLLERFMGDWVADPAFPPLLPIKGKQYPTFNDLCECHGCDFSAPSLLRILKERELVEVVDEYVVFKRGELISPYLPERIESARRSIKALFSTLYHNLSDAEPLFTERRLWSCRIPHDQIRTLRDKVREINMEYRERIMEELDAYEMASDTDEAACFSEVGLGVYWYELDEL